MERVVWFVLALSRKRNPTVNADLCVPESVLSVVHVDGGQQFLRSLFAVDELSFGDGAGVEYSVSVIDTGPVSFHLSVLKKS